MWSLLLLLDLLFPSRIAKGVFSEPKNEISEDNIDSISTGVA